MTHQPWCQVTRAVARPRHTAPRCTCQLLPDDPRWAAYVEDLRLRVEEQTREGRVTTLEPPLDRTLGEPSGTVIERKSWWRRLLRRFHVR